MKPIDPRRLDVAALACAGSALHGQWPLALLPRLAASVLAEQCPDALAAWRVRGESRPVSADEPQIWLHLEVAATVALRCQRCLGVVHEALDVRRAIRFVADEATAEALDAEAGDDVLALPRRLDLLALVEDELLLALPLVPRHAACPQPLPLTTGADADAAPAAHPFAALARLKGVSGPGST